MTSQQDALKVMQEIMVKLSSAGPDISKSWISDQIACINDRMIGTHFGKKYFNPILTSALCGLGYLIASNPDAPCTLYVSSREDEPVFYIEIHSQKTWWEVEIWLRKLMNDV